MTTWSNNRTQPPLYGWAVAAQEDAAVMMAFSFMATIAFGLDGLTFVKFAIAVGALLASCVIGFIVALASSDEGHWTDRRAFWGSVVLAIIWSATLIAVVALNLLMSSHVDQAWVCLSVASGLSIYIALNTGVI